MVRNSHLNRRALRVAACVVSALLIFSHVLAAESDSDSAHSELGETNDLAISATEIDFGSIAPGEAESAILVFTNVGAPESGNIVINNLFLDELDSKYYSLSTNASIKLAPSESFELVIGFEPRKLGAMPGRLTVSHTGKSGVDTIDLYGEGADIPSLSSANPISFPFGKSSLANFDGGKPTSLQFGPDGKLYVAFMDGEIHVMDIERNAANDYVVTHTDEITLVKNIVNHNDDGSIQTNLNQRLVTGLLVAGSASKPVIYVSSSDPRIGGGSSGHTTNLDTNSGVLSRLTKTSSGWQKLDLVRGLPRSEENHHTNGLALVGSTLYIAAGGHTNMGAPSNNFAVLPEYALSAAILSVDLDQIGENTYDLPTLDDEDRSGPDDYNDPFGGNRGKNQAMLVADGPVQVYAPGFRNPYDVVAMQNGRLYSWDNGPNSGWGGTPKSCFNSVSEPGSTQHDALHLISGPGYYAGHPNPTRGSQKNTFNKKNPQSPVPYDNTIECNYYGPGTNGNGKNAKNNSLISLPRSTNGLAEYTASNMSGSLASDLLVVSWDNKVYRVSFESSGEMDDINVLFSNVGISPLDITAQSDSSVFPGTIWVADLQDKNIVVYEPDDFEGGGSSGDGCDVSVSDGDADLDGFSNIDELTNGTDGCSAADVPADVDGDRISDLMDPDDDNDNIPDVDDPFAIDPSNGAMTSLPVDYQWENDSPSAGFIANLGFTGLMNNGVDSYQSQYNLDDMTIIGAAGVVTVDNVPPGDPIADINTQKFGFQFGVDVGPSSEIFRVQTRVLAPFSGFTPKLHQSMGLFIGSGNQDNYVKLVINQSGAQMLSEIAGDVYSNNTTTTSFSDIDFIDLTIQVDPASAIATSFMQITRNDLTEQEIQIASIDFPATWLTGPTKLAIGILSTSFRAQPFPATWDFITVKPLNETIVNQAPTVEIMAVGNVTTGVQTFLGASVTDDSLPNNNITYQWSYLSGPGMVSFAGSTQESTAATFSEIGSYTLQLTATDGEYTATDTITVTVTRDESAIENVVYRINAGGPLISAVDGDWLSDSASSQYFNTGITWKSTATIDSSDIGTGVPSALFNTERYDKSGGPELEWKLPVTPGEYIVRLYFAEIYFGAMKSGVRVFDVAVEDQLESAVDVFATVGANKAMVMSFTVQTDDTLNILFSRIKQNPAIKGIEVLRSDAAVLQPEIPISPVNQAPLVDAGENVTTALTKTVSLSGSVVDDGLPDNSATVTWTMQSGPAAVTFGNPDSVTTTASFSEAGEYVLRLSATDTLLLSFDELVINVEDEPTASTIYRINAGGPLIFDSNGNWDSDQGASSRANTGNTYSKGVAVDTSATQTIPEQLFQSERWDPKSGASMNWTLPVAPGNYDVHLYFSEIYEGTMGNGKRVFDVAVEGQQLSALDVFAEAGANTAIVKTFSVLNTDGVIDIVFNHIVENPAIKGIEVISRP